MAYKVKSPFRDKMDKSKKYQKGDSYSHDDEKRIAFLIDQGYLESEPTDSNNVDIRHTGGGWYELPNGEKVKGKEAAEKALEEM